MAETVGQHSVAAFTSPVNGTTPIDANTVRGNDNTVRSAYVDHDADPGIHVQSSTLASRPVAGTAGRKWITVSSGRYQLWYDDGSRWHEVASDAVNVDCLADTALTKGDVIKITGFNNGQNLPTVAKVSASTDTAFGLVENTVSSGAIVQIINTGLIEDVDTNGYAVGTVLYPNTSGGWTTAKPTSGNYQPAGYVLRGNTNTGVLYVEFSAPRIVERSDNTASTIVLRDASGDFSAGTITATAVNTTTIDLTNLEVTNIKAKDGTASMAIADSTGVVTVSAAPVLSALTASQAVFTNSSKALVSNAITGTGNVVMSASPTLTGTVTAATLNATTLGGTLSTAAQPNVTSVGTLTSLTVSGDLTVDTSTLKVDSTNNRVGIGTASPSFALDVTGVARFGSGVGAGDASLDIGAGRSGNGTAFLDLVTDNTTYTDFGLRLIRNSGVNGTSFLSHRGTGEFGLLANEAAPITFYTSNTERMRLDASGNLSVGTATALGTAAGRGSITVNGSGTSILSFGVGGSLAGYVLHEGTDMWVNNTLAGALRLYTNGSERARIDASGNLLVGAIANPGILNKSVVIDSGSSSLAGYVLQNDTTGRTSTDGSALYINGSTLSLFNLENAAMVFGTNNAERARITSGGYFKASNDGTYVSSTGGYHELVQSGSALTAYIRNTNVAPYGLELSFTSSPDDNTYWFLKAQDGTAARCYIWSDGDLANHDGVYGTISDERLKQDIVDANSQWDDIKAIRFRKYRMKTDVAANPDAPAMLGVVAQELEQVSPGLVDEHPDFEEREVTDEDGNVTTERVQVGTTKTVKSSILLMKAAVALQEAMARIEALEVEVAALKASA